MALKWVYRIGGTGTTLTQDEVDNNILCIYGALSQYGWSKQAICGAIGCFYEESNMNPGIYETSHGGTINNLPYFAGGMGLAQWTDYPAYTATYPNPLAWSAQHEGKEWYDGNFQCWLLTKADDDNYTSMGYGQGPRWGWQTSSSYPSISFQSYIRDTSHTIREMVTYWFYDLEWHSSTYPDWVDFEARARWGQYAYDLIEGRDPEVPEGWEGYAGNLQGFINWCIEKCNDPNVGYSQAYRAEQTVNGITYYDCSSFVWYGLAHNDFDIEATGHSDYAFDTAAMPTDLPKMGWAEIDRNGELKPGDIGVSSDHTEVVYTGGNGEAVFMGAHSSSYPLAEQVSISDFTSQGTRFEHIYRFMGGISPAPKKKKGMPIWMMLKRYPF